MLNQATLLINTLLLAMACALLSVAVKAAPGDSAARPQPAEPPVSISMHGNRAIPAIADEIVTREM